MPTVSVPVTFDAIALRYEQGEAALLEQFAKPFIEQKIQDTVARVETRWGSRIQERLNAGTLSATLYTATIAEAVLRVLRNPEGFKSEQEGNYSNERDGRVAGGYLMFTKENVEDLLGDRGSASFVGTARIGIGA